MKYLKLSGMILLYLLLYFIIQVILFISVGIVEGVRYAMSGRSFNPESILDIIAGSMSLVIILSTVVTLLIYLLIYKLRKRNMIELCRFKPIGYGKMAAIGVLGIALNFFTVTTLYVTSAYEYFPDHNEIMEALLMSDSFVLTLLAIGIFAPIFEEILFRGIIYNELKEHMSSNLVIIIQALLFAIYHMNMLQGLYAFVLGIFLGVVYKWYKNIWAPIVIHVIYNSTSVVLSRTADQSFVLNNSLPIILVSLIVMSAILYLLYKGKREDIEEICDEIK